MNLHVCIHLIQHRYRCLVQLVKRHFIGSGPLKGILKHRELALEDDIQE